ncbi:MAG: ribokinase [Chloroflexi bacterium]|nr:ribokinase [Chloroflexota bacterium]
MSSVTELDYLVIGHVTRDLANGAFAVGGTASYAARTAFALGCRVGIVTSANLDLDLSQILGGIQIARDPASAMTTFENIYTPEGRRQIVHSLSNTLTPDMLPSDWMISPDSGVVHVGPVAGECDPAWADEFGDTFVGVTPQGWMRRWDQSGHVSGCLWEGAEPWLARADAVVLSSEDVGSDESLIAQYASQTQLLAVTHGSTGCTVYTRGEARSFLAPTVDEVDPTGAGDIFATALFVALSRYNDPWAAARFANCVAAGSVARVRLESTPKPDEIARCEHIHFSSRK